MKDLDYVPLRRFGFSLQRLMRRYPDGAPDSVIAAALQIPESEVESRFQEIVKKLRDLMGVKV